MLLYHIMIVVRNLVRLLEIAAQHSPLSSQLISNILTAKWTWLSLQIILRQLNMLAHTYIVHR
jgi:hypothetical protein